jgi:hypothetical protein
MTLLYLFPTIQAAIDSQNEDNKKVLEQFATNEFDDKRPKENDKYS